MKKTILYVEEDLKYGEKFKELLINDGYEVNWKQESLDAMEVAAVDEFDIVIFSLYMENINGLQFLKYIRKIKPAMRTVMLTARPCMDTELEALELFVDLYLPKDTRDDVMLCYIERLYDEREPLIAEENILKDSSEGIVIDLLSREVWKNEELINLTPKKFDITAFLLQNKGIAVSREKLLEELWDTQEIITNIHIIDTHIKGIRRTLDTNAITSVRGHGYRWNA